MHWSIAFGSDAADAQTIAAWTTSGTTQTTSPRLGQVRWTPLWEMPLSTSAVTRNQWVTATSTQTANETYWYVQEDQVLHAQYLALAQGRAQYCRERTAEELQIAAERQRQASELQRVNAEKRLAALERSKELLLANLNTEQRQTFEKNRWFVVEGGRSKQRYRIKDSGYSGNIEVLRGDAVLHRLCVHCLDGAVPLYDHLLAQKLHLQYDEDRLLQIANRHAA